tara:strand:+ start:345 stop:635 length:291 start_codon:yes stop_codon:yes gene_type:complete
LIVVVAGNACLGFMENGAVCTIIFCAGIFVIEIGSLGDGLQKFIIPGWNAFVIGVARVTTCAGISVIADGADGKPRYNAAFATYAFGGSSTNRNFT